MTRRRKVLLLCGLPLALFLAALAAWHVWLNGQLDAAYARSRQQGYPTTSEELEAYYPAPTGENAADVYFKAFKARVMPPVEPNERIHLIDALRDAGNEPVTEEQGPPLRRYVDANAEAIRLLHEAAELGPARFPVDFKAGWQMDLRHLPELREAGTLLFYDAHFAAEAGDLDRALGSVLALIGMAESLKNEPILISQLTRVSVLERAAQALGTALGTGVISEDNAVRLPDRLAPIAVRPDFVRAMIAERSVLVCAFEADSGYVNYMYNPVSEVFPRLSGMVNWLRSRSGIGALQLLFYLDLVEPAIADLMLPAYESGAAWMEIDQRLAAAGPLRANLAAMTLPGFDYIPYPAARGDAYVQAMLTALAVDSFYRGNGQFPATLIEITPDLMPVVPVDPFDGQPLRYRADGSWFVVYSVSTDQTDDHGNVWGRRHEDVGVIVEYAGKVEDSVER